ncbi:hypothetical protein RR48_12583 [Papilio machaon]|uniref:Secreted protein n=1 Tax=Papilio machaon TaxID=76193 RepID=A0A194RNI8_PAPMA|nr:hypothetical protein RR48_12583 [Papilio machaon]
MRQKGIGLIQLIWLRAHFSDAVCRDGLCRVASVAIPVRVSWVRCGGRRSDTTQRVGLVCTRTCRVVTRQKLMFKSAFVVDPLTCARGKAGSLPLIMFTYPLIIALGNM